jgi:hypothetical protein
MNFAIAIAIAISIAIAICRLTLGGLPLTFGGGLAPEAMESAEATIAACNHIVMLLIVLLYCKQGLSEKGKVLTFAFDVLE